MDYLRQFVDLFLHLDKHLAELVADYGPWTYLVLFVIIVCETGLVIAPILPGDSLLFAAGAIAALPPSDAGATTLNPHLIVVLLIVAAIIGDAMNYQVGRYLGPKILKKEDSRFFKREHLDKTRAFYEKYGGKTIVLARFLPIIRTFAPFLAGVGKMSYPQFAMYNVTGAVLWVTIGVYAGYWFGNIPVVRENFTLVLVAIVAISLMPAVIEYWRARRQKAAAAPES